MNFYLVTHFTNLDNIFHQNFKIEQYRQFGVYDNEGDYVVLSDHIPDNSKFFVSFQNYLLGMS